MKPTISLALITLGLTFPAPAMAAPTHLTCTEKTATEREPLDRLVFINPETGTASVGGQRRDLFVEPNRYRLIHGKNEPHFFISSFDINRTTLHFTTRVLTDSRTYESSGQCQITPTAAGAQI